MTSTNNKVRQKNLYGVITCLGETFRQKSQKKGKLPQKLPKLTQNCQMKSKWSRQAAGNQQEKIDLTTNC